MATLRNPVLKPPPPSKKKNVTNEATITASQKECSKARGLYHGVMTVKARCHRLWPLTLFLSVFVTGRPPQFNSPFNSVADCSLIWDSRRLYKAPDCWPVCCLESCYTAQSHLLLQQLDSGQTLLHLSGRDCKS